MQILEAESEASNEEYERYRRRLPIIYDNSVFVVE